MSIPDLSKQALGRWGEDLAARWYSAHGYEVLSRNWRCPSGELDIVARRPGLTIFCEVKTRASVRFGVPAESVSPTKQARSRRLAAAWFASQRGYRWTEARFDIASVVNGKLEIIEAAF